MKRVVVRARLCNNSCRGDNEKSSPLEEPPSGTSGSDNPVADERARLLASLRLTAPHASSAWHCSRLSSRHACTFPPSWPCAARRCSEPARTPCASSTWTLPTPSAAWASTSAARCELALRVRVRPSGAICSLGGFSGASTQHRPPGASSLQTLSHPSPLTSARCQVPGARCQLHPPCRCQLPCRSAARPCPTPPWSGTPRPALLVTTALPAGVPLCSLTLSHLSPLTLYPHQLSELNVLEEDELDALLAGATL